MLVGEFRFKMNSYTKLSLIFYLYSNAMFNFDICNRVYKNIHVKCFVPMNMKIYTKWKIFRKIEKKKSVGLTFHCRQSAHVGILDKTNRYTNHHRGGINRKHFVLPGNGMLTEAAQTFLQPISLLAGHFWQPESHHKWNRPYRRNGHLQVWT